MKKRGRVRNRPTIINDEPRDAKPLNWSKSSVSVGHEDLRMGNRNLDSSTLHRRSSSFQDVTHQPTSLGSTPRARTVVLPKQGHTANVRAPGELEAIIAAG